MTDLLLLFLIVLGVNLLPAFGPPTWSVLVLYTLNTDLPVVPTVLTGASAAALGRYLLAVAFRFLGSRLPERNRRNLAAAKQIVGRSKSRKIIAVGLFALSPLPSAQLFEVAGLLRVRLLPFTAAFFAGRLVSYFIYASTAAKVRETSIGAAFREALSQPVGIALQVLLIAMLVVLARVDWARVKMLGTTAPRSLGGPTAAIGEAGTSGHPESKARQIEGQMMTKFHIPDSCASFIEGQR